MIQLYKESLNDDDLNAPIKKDRGYQSESNNRHNHMLSTVDLLKYKDKCRLKEVDKGKYANANQKKWE